MRLLTVAVTVPVPVMMHACQLYQLRGLLMDVELQAILQECYEPAALRRHMSDPATARKIKRLYDAGLVGTATDK